MEGSMINDLLFIIVVLTGTAVLSFVLGYFVGRGRKRRR